MANKVNFSAGTLAQYQASAKDVSTLYFITDAGKIFKGAVDVTSNIVIVTEFGDASAAFEDKFYLNISTFEMRIKSGSAWIVMSPGYLTDNVNWADADSGKFATIGLIKKGIAEAISAIATSVSFDPATGIVNVNGSEAELTGVPYKFEYSADSLTIEISSYGSEEKQVINLPKDNFVKSGSYVESTNLPDGSTGPAIVLVVNNGVDGDQQVVIPAASLVDVYTGESSNDIKVEVSEGNVIKASAIIDPAEGNALVSTENGLKVDISGKADKLTADSADHILVGSADGNLADSGYTVASLIAAAVEASQGSIDALAERVEALEGITHVTIDDVNSAVNEALAGYIKLMGAGNADEIVLSVEDGSVKRSAKKIGSDVLGDSSDVVATEKAVQDAINNAYSWGTI